MRKMDARRAKGVVGRLAAAGLTLALALSTVVSAPATAAALEATPGGPVTTDDGVTLTKLAAWDEATDDRANVELTVGSTEEVVESYVTFVIDKSTSTDVRAEANQMLEELLNQTTDGTVVNVSVVSFENSSDVIQGWTVLNGSTIGDIQDAINTKKNESGTNIQKGLATARDLLSNVSGHKYLVLLTDGITYQWGDGMTIYSESASNGEESLNAGNDMNGKHHTDLESYYAEFSDIAQWKQDHGDAIAQDVQTYARKYTAGQIQPNNGKGNQAESTYEGFDEANNDYVKAEDLTKHYSANDAAVYMSVVEWQNLANDGVTLFAYADATGSNAANAVSHPWAFDFVSSLGTVSGTSGLVDDNTVDGMFDGVMNTVLYEIQRGTVTDVIGAEFDLAGLDTIKLTVGDTEYDGVVDEEAGTVTFDDGNYVVKYDPMGEKLTWEINKAVASAEPVTLSYALDLSNKATDAGTYQVPTNKQASISYDSTDGSKGAGQFLVPVLEYTVEEPAPVMPDPVTIGGGSFNVKKVLEGDGAALQAEQFTFELVDSEGNVVSTAKNAADGTVTFDDLTFTTAGEYNYTIREALPTDDDASTDGVQSEGVTYDETVHNVRVVVTEQDGKLVAQPYVVSEDGTVVFTNTYVASDTAPSTPTTDGEGIPNTGDATSLVVALGALVGGSGAVATGIALRRRNK